MTLRPYIQGSLGVLSLGIFFLFGCVYHLEPFYTYFYLFAWGSFILILDRLLLAQQGMGLFSYPQRFLWLLWLSTNVWLLFELFNFRLHNWVYIGLPREGWIRWPGYALSFATVMPGILMLGQLLEPRTRFLFASRMTDQSPDLDLRFQAVSFLSGSVMLVLVLARPFLFFPLLWGGVFLMGEPLVMRLRGHSLLHDWLQGRWRLTGSLLLSGLLCGLFWEFCNFWAGAKWQYTLPYANFGKLFEMPLLGFLGFPPFALEIFVLYQAATRAWGRWGPPARSLVVLASLLYWLAVFYGIDRWTVIGWR